MFPWLSAVIEAVCTTGPFGQHYLQRAIGSQPQVTTRPTELNKQGIEPESANCVRTHSISEVTFAF